MSHTTCETTLSVFVSVFKSHLH